MGVKHSRMDDYFVDTNPFFTFIDFQNIINTQEIK